MSHKAFSLVELSIVLVILGLLTGGILTGQSLIRASELRSVASDMQRYNTAVLTFRDKYFGLPGDYRDATKFWGVLAGTGSDATCQNTAATGLPTCNGNGDGIVDGSGVVGFDERFRAWQHLANAGLIEGSYTGKTNGASGTAICVRGLNSPVMKISNATAAPVYVPAGTGDSTWFDRNNNRNSFFFFSVSGAQPLKGEEAWNIDIKMDDGKPAYGNVFSTKNTGAWCTGCATTDVASTAEYALTNSNQVCCLYLAFP